MKLAGFKRDAWKSGPAGSPSANIVADPSRILRAESILDPPVRKAVRLFIDVPGRCDIVPGRD